MPQNFNWRDCVLLHWSNADFLRGETTGIYNDSENRLGAICNGIIAFFLAGFVAQFILMDFVFICLCALPIGIWVVVAGWRGVATSVTIREKSTLSEGELLEAKPSTTSDSGTDITYRFLLPQGQIHTGQTYTGQKPDWFSKGDRLVILLAPDGTHTVL